MEVIKFIKNQIAEAILNLNTAMPCKVLSYNESTRRAKIQPLFQMKEVGRNPENLPPIDDVPVLYYRLKVNGNSQTYIPDLKAGDVVLAVFCQRAIDDVLTGKIAYPDVSRHHDLHDAIIVGVIT
ncbi:hypothetical protein HNR63_001112 [Anoxybacillus kamchatkensis]|jgi:hypothetical protein|uniref:Gp138 family membrane-puncturing spike protein n=1 Tax=Anoxybacillus ayderensis TaxID=265546 RepID=UPI0015EBC650|nr:Gp138 family membrane-puncturing spike protein [Anoxybacillus ayderensis]MBA2878058.1 hypothetical protein [Anoxybacillus ayderensis]